MTRSATQRLAVLCAGIAAVVVVGGVAAAAMVGSDRPAQQQPVTVSDESLETPAAEQAGPTPSDEASPTATAPTAAPTKKPTRRPTVTEPEPDPTEEPPGGGETGSVDGRQPDRVPPPSPGQPLPEPPIFGQDRPTDD
ncbi:hypothetical protein AB0C02_28185 [Micromonospora sp. NPDC048999]|uniref:hypothetical protein n=1 Tax=Micromonospora sp. NPDC048999 TaxID=3155391 RepID=UPI0033F6D8B2